MQRRYDWFEQSWVLNAVNAETGGGSSSGVIVIVMVMCNGNAISVISASDHIWVASVTARGHTARHGPEADLEIC